MNIEEVGQAVADYGRVCLKGSSQDIANATAELKEAIELYAESRSVKYVVMAVGCIECHDETEVLATFDSLEAAKKYYLNAPVSEAGEGLVVEWNNSIVIFELPTVTK